MAIIKPGPLIAEARGTIGGQVFSRSPAGLYVRSWASPTQPPSTRRSTVRDAWAFASLIWATVLTDVERAAWNAMAQLYPVTNRLGMQIYLTGRQWAMRVNSLRKLGGLTHITTPPTPPHRSQFYTAFVNAANVVTVAITGGLGTTSKLFVFSARTSRFRNYWKGPYDQMLALDASVTTGQTIDTVTDRLHIAYRTLDSLGCASAISYTHIDATGGSMLEGGGEESVMPESEVPTTDPTVIPTRARVRQPTRLPLQPA